MDLLLSTAFVAAYYSNIFWAISENRTHDPFPTKEVLYPWATTASILRRRQHCERKTGLEPATYSLEGYRSTKWATSAD